MIEQLELVEDGDRVICPYFPLHTAILAFTIAASPYYKFVDLPFPPDPFYIENGTQIFTAERQLEVKVNNGGALYYTATANENGLFEAVLQHLIPGLDPDPLTEAQTIVDGLA